MTAPRSMVSSARTGAQGVGRPRDPWILASFLAHARHVEETIAVETDPEAGARGRYDVRALGRVVAALRAPVGAADAQVELDLRIDAAIAVARRTVDPTRRLAERLLLELRRRADAGDFAPHPAMSLEEVAEYEEVVRAMVAPVAGPPLAAVELGLRGRSLRVGVFGPPDRRAGRIVVQEGEAPLLGIAWDTVESRYGPARRAIWGLGSAAGRGANDPGLIRRGTVATLELYRRHVDRVVRAVGPYTDAGFTYARLFADELYPSIEHLERQP